MEMLIHSIKLWGNASIMENFKPLTNYLDDAIFIFKKKKKRPGVSILANF